MSRAHSMFGSIAWLPRLTPRTFARNNDGGVLPIFTVALLPVVGFIGAAVDYSRANDVRSAMQATLDIALLAGARDGTTNWANVAADVFSANVKSKGASVATPVF